VQGIESALAEDLRHLGIRRFVPYIQLHEFEALLFVMPSLLLRSFPGREQNVSALEDVLRDHGNNPEAIDDAPATAPSKRIVAVIPEFAGRKAQVGPLTAELAGISALRATCRHFHEWLQNLEALAE
jgi:hypothetical protein